MYGFLLLIYLIVCFGLIVVILLQSSKGGGLAGAFGGGGDMGAVFGGRGAASFLSRVTTGLATVFMLLSLVLSLINRGDTQSGGLIQQEQQKRTTLPSSVPVVPSEDGQQGVLPQQQAPAQGATQAPVDTSQ